MSQKSTKSCQDEHKMDYASHASTMVALIAGQRGWNDTRESWLARAARRLGFSYSRTRSLYYQRARIISAQEWDRMKDELAQLKQTAARSQEIFHELDLLERNGPEGAGQDARLAPHGSHDTSREGPSSVDPDRASSIR